MLIYYNESTGKRKKKMLDRSRFGMNSFNLRNKLSLFLTEYFIGHVVSLLIVTLK